MSKPTHSAQFVKEGDEVTAIGGNGMVGKVKRVIEYQSIPCAIVQWPNSKGRHTITTLKKVGKHRINWADDGMVGISHCDDFALDLTLTAWNGPMRDGKKEDHIQTCPRCGARLLAHWGVHVEVIK